MAPLATRPAVTVDLTASSTREVNELLASSEAPKALTITNPRGAHALACGLDAELEVTIDGDVGYYCAGMNKHASVTINGNAGVGLAENMMSGTVRVTGDASQSAGATGHGGLLVIEGNASARCGISMKGIDIVVKGSIGPMSAFMAQAGNLVVLGDAGDALGDSIYEARLFVRGSVASLGADCVEKPMSAEDKAVLQDVLKRAQLEQSVEAGDFKMFGSARGLYHSHVDNVDAY